MQTVTIVCVGKLKDRFFVDASKEYEKRLTSFCRLNIVEIPAEDLPAEPNKAQIDKCLDREADKILSKVNRQGTVVAMCIEGKLFSSEDLARQLDTAGRNGNGDVTFIIGGSYGLSDRVKETANVKMSMSPMTFPHRLARIMLLEQIYRGYMINSGRRYHK